MALSCTASALSGIIPAYASVTFAISQPENSTFFVPGSDVAYPHSPTDLRALCAVEIQVQSSATSAYSFGLFLPEQWNGRFLAVGNAGFGGGVNWMDMAAGVGYGFASMSTDTGHSSYIFDGRWALNKESVTDWGYRSMHDSVVLAKEVITSYYGSTPQYNYYSGCSTGGRQGLKEAQMFPEDFDGIVIGAPAWWTSHLQPWTVKLALYNLPITAVHHIPPELFHVIEAEVMAQCDGQDGLVDSIISNPQACIFSPEPLRCGPGVTNQTEQACLTAWQIDTLEHIYSDYMEKYQTFVFPHLELGSESQWEVLMGSPEPSSLGTDYIRYFMLDDPDWDFYDFGYHIVELADQLQPGNATVDDFDLNTFHARGGKLLHYHGLSDGLIPSGSSEYFYEQVWKQFNTEGIGLDEWYRFFLVPGMQHCAGTSPQSNAPWYFAGASQAGFLGNSAGSSWWSSGFGNSRHDILLALMEWTEKDVPPDLVATKWHNDTLQDRVWRQRPLCPYGQHAAYTGSGPVDDVSSWKCVSSAVGWHGMIQQDSSSSKTSMDREPA